MKKLSLAQANILLFDRFGFDSKQLDCMDIYAINSNFESVNILLRFGFSLNDFILQMEKLEEFGNVNWYNGIISLNNGTRIYRKDYPNFPFYMKPNVIKNIWQKSKIDAK